jgi:hypothetical protein
MDLIKIIESFLSYSTDDLLVYAMFKVKEIV